MMIMKKWYFSNNGDITGPMNLEDAVSFLNDGNSLADLVAVSKSRRKEAKKSTPAPTGFKFLGFE